MSGALGLVLVIMLIGGALFVILVVVGGGAKALVEACLGLIDIGRKGARAVATIPDELKKEASPLPKFDPDRDALIAYKPRPPFVGTPNIVFFSAPSSKIFHTHTEPAKVIDINSIGRILTMGPRPPYEPALDLPSEPPLYPATPPAEPPPIEPPPIWTPWRPQIAEPSFEPPLWGRPLRILNGFVLKAYETEIMRFNEATIRRIDLLQQCEYRNEQVAALAEKAMRVWSKADDERKRAFAAAKAIHVENEAAWDEQVRKESKTMAALRAETTQQGASGLLKRIELTMKAMTLPAAMSADYETRFDADSGIVIHEQRFPDSSGVEWTKRVRLKAGWTSKPATKKERREAAAKLHPSLCLRLAAEIARLDSAGIIKAIAVNGWADYTELTTGQRKRAYLE